MNDAIATCQLPPARLNKQSTGHTRRASHSPEPSPRHQAYYRGPSHHTTCARYARSPRPRRSARASRRDRGSVRRARRWVVIGFLLRSYTRCQLASLTRRRGRHTGRSWGARSSSVTSSPSFLQVIAQLKPPTTAHSSAWPLPVSSGFEFTDLGRSLPLRRAL